MTHVMYECNECQTQKCMVQVLHPDGQHSLEHGDCMRGFKPCWCLQRLDNIRPPIVWEDTDDPAIRQLQEYVERAVNHG